MVSMAACKAPSPEATVAFDNAYINRPPPVSKMAAGYVAIHNRSDQAVRLISASSPVFNSVEIHETYADGSVMSMRRLESLEIPANGTVELQPGGVHLMLMGRAKELDESVDIGFVAESGERFDVRFEVVDYSR